MEINCLLRTAISALIGVKKVLFSHLQKQYVFDSVRKENSFQLMAGYVY